jgi:hypothetical protein
LLIIFALIFNSSSYTFRMGLLKTIFSRKG